MQKTGITTSWSDNKLRPGQAINRNTMAAFIFRMKNNHYANTRVAYEWDVESASN